MKDPANTPKTHFAVFGQMRPRFSFYERVEMTCLLALVLCLVLWASSNAFRSYKWIHVPNHFQKGYRPSVARKLGEREGNCPVTIESINSLKNQIKTTSEQISALQSNYNSIIQETKKFDEEFGERIKQINEDFQRMKAREDGKEIIIRTRTEALKDLWPSFDSFLRMTKLYVNTPAQAEKDVAQHYSALYQKLDKMLQNFGLTRKDTLGTYFDANYMEALCTLPSTIYPNDVVCQEYHPSYELQGRCIRPALVAISDGPGPS